MKRTLPIGAIMVFILMTSFVGCAFAAYLPKVNDLQFVSGNAGASWLKMAAVIADRVNTHFDGFPIHAIPGGSIANLPVVSKGNAHIGFSQGPFLAAGLNGIAPYDVPMKNIRSICALVPMAVYFLVDADVTGDTLGEVLKSDKKLSIGTTPRGNSSCFIAEYVFNCYGLDSLDDIKKLGGKVMYADGASLGSAWSDYHINFNIRNTSLPSSEITELLSVRRSKLLGLESEIIKRLVADYGFIPMTIPAGTYKGQGKDIHTIGVSTVIVAHESVPNIVAHAIAKVVREDKKYIEASVNAFKDFNDAEMADGLVFPIHPGARQYFEEVGIEKLEKSN